MVFILTKMRIYLETTMFNYYFDKDRDGHAATVRMFEAIKKENMRDTHQAMLFLSFKDPKSEANKYDGTNR